MTAAFSPYANWVVPGKVMQGEYPGQSAELCSSKEAAIERMSKILTDGHVSTFCSFLHELPTQEDMPEEGKDGFVPYKALAEDVAQELKLGRQLHFLRLPFVVGKELRMDMMLALTKELQGRVEAGEVVYLHCSGGRGRAGTAAACLYARLSGDDPDQVLRHIQESFDTRGAGGESPVSERQRKFVHDFAVEIKSPAA